MKRFTLALLVLLFCVHSALGAIQSTTEWRIRSGGDASNGGGYDSGISGAGTDYTDQDSHQLSLSDLATSGAGVTTLTSATGGFTSAMIGNCIRISSGTNVTTGYYFVTAHTDTNTVTVDRAPDDGVGGISSGVGKLGGAFASFENLAGTGNGGLSSPAITSPLGEGHTVWIRSDDSPTGDWDYDWDGTGAGYWSSNTNGGGTGGRIRIEGYGTGNSGYPRIQTSGVVWLTPDYWHLEHLAFFKNTSSSLAHYGILDNGSGTNASRIVDCKHDLNNQDAAGFTANVVRNCYIDGSDDDTGGAGTEQAIQGTNYGYIVEGNVVEHYRGTGFGVDGNIMGMFQDNIANDCRLYGFYSNSQAKSWSTHFWNNVAYSSGSDGFRFNTFASGAQSTAFNNIAVSNGGYGINISSGSDALNDALLRGAFDYNGFYNNTSGSVNGFTSGDNDVALSGDPFTNAGSGDFSLDNTASEGAALREAGWPGVFLGISTTGYRDIGAAETQDAGGGGASAYTFS